MVVISGEALYCRYLKSSEKGNKGARLTAVLHLFSVGSESPQQIRAGIHTDFEREE